MQLSIASCPFLEFIASECVGRAENGKLDEVLRCQLCAVSAHLIFHWDIDTRIRLFA